MSTLIIVLGVAALMFSMVALVLASTDWARYHLFGYVCIASIVVAVAAIVTGSHSHQSSIEAQVIGRYGVHHVDVGPVNSNVAWTSADNTQRCWGRYDTDMEALEVYGCATVLQPTGPPQR